MEWIRLLLGAIDLIRRAAIFLEQRQLLEAGAATAIAAGLLTAQADIRRALDARAEVRRRWDAEPDSRNDDDGFRRD